MAINRAEKWIPDHKVAIRAEPAHGSLVAQYSVVVLLLACFDFFVGVDIASLIVYTIPVGLACWHLGKTGGFMIALFSFSTWAFVHTVSPMAPPLAIESLCTAILQVPILLLSRTLVG